MSLIRKLSTMRGPLMLALILSALGMNALIPTGYMLAPSADGSIAVTACPTTNALARSLAERDALADDGIDHAAMGHVVEGSDDDSDKGSGLASPSKDCAFSALASGATLPDAVGFDWLAAVESDLTAPELQAFATRPARYLRPPLRGPPLLG